MNGLLHLTSQRPEAIQDFPNGKESGASPCGKENGAKLSESGHGYIQHLSVPVLIYFDIFSTGHC